MANTAEKKNIFKRIGGFFVRLVKGIGRKFREMFYELKKVTWPTKKDMINIPSWCWCSSSSWASSSA